MADTSIEWVKNPDGSSGKSWNCIRGCSRVSPGCGGPGKFGGCYAEKIAARFSDPGQAFHGFAERKGGEARWTGKMALIEDMLTLPLRWRKPTRIFANSMSDLWHTGLPEDAVDRVLAVAALAHWHTIIILTKRSAHMRAYMSAPGVRYRIIAAAQKLVADGRARAIHFAFPWPLPNVWLGVSAERQQEADERVPHLLATPAAVRFVSAEPLLGGIDFRHIVTGERTEIDALTGFQSARSLTVAETGSVEAALATIPPYPIPAKRLGLDQIIVGAESGPRARPMELQWAGDILAQCKVTGVAAFMKQLSGPGGHAIKDMALFPEDLRIREFPRAS